MNTRVIAALVVGLTVAGAGRAADVPQFNRDIRPILVENCFACHGPDSAARKADLRLDRREEAVKAEVIVPGKPEKSPLIERIFATKPNQMMPPPKSHKTLTAAQKDLLKRWVAAGAEYQPHWSFIAAQRPAVPAIKNASWARNSIDRFVLAELEKRGLQPAPEADRRTLARRASLDVTGLPPAPEDAERFVNDKAPDAYEQYVDRLLKSKQWGEHRGRHWLDVARYADTHGIHFDNYRENWAYRDWVIKAFNDNKPFNRFTIEQLAGDLLPNRTLDQIVASGFNRCNITTNEGGAISEEYLVLYTRDRTETVSQVWLGLTTGCAVCHDHKFDPISQREFYEMSAFFNNTTQGAMDGNIKDTPPILLVPRPEDLPRYDVLAKELTEARTAVEARKKMARADHDKWLASAKAEEVLGQVPTDQLQFHAALSEGSGKQVKLSVGGQARTQDLAGAPVWDTGHIAAKALKARQESVLEVPEVGDFDRSQAFSYGAWIRLPRRGTTGAAFSRMDDKSDYRGWDLWIEGDKVGTHIVHKWPDDALKVVGQTQLQPNQWYHVFVSYDGSGKAAGVKVYVNGKPEPIQASADKLKGTTRTTVPWKLAQRGTSSPIENLLIQDVRVYGRALTAVDVDRLAKTGRASYLLAKGTDKLTKPEKDELFDWWLVALDEGFAKLAGQLSQLTQEETTIRARGTIAHVMQERGPDAMAHILFRGEYDKRRDPVKPGTPKMLPAMSPNSARNRLGFAEWLMQPDHPLTARVTVNRFWQEVFGQGLVRTSGDFGIAGEQPSHPELLDWLAVEFREKDWDVKQFFKLMLTSATYRQAAVTTPEKREKDLHNRWLSRGPRFRMDAEMIRDHALASGGLLSTRIGGPSVKPYQPEGVWEAVAMIGSNTRDYRRDTGENLYRRSMYTFWKRSAPPASMEILNAPNRETCTVRRERTNTPLQALVTLNDVQFVEAARNLAQMAIKDAPATDARIDFMTQRLIARSLRPEERKVVTGVLTDLLTHYKAKADDAKKLIAVGESRPDASLDAAELAAWTMLANQLMNLDEVLNK
ncbi:MAG: DUF1553 domain-containing protein [Gemmataceae bacterium]|nr:DUF1553 domain-containing protein [Gemmataceae bacterium]